MCSDNVIVQVSSFCVKHVSERAATERQCPTSHVDVNTFCCFVCIKCICVFKEHLAVLYVVMYVASSWQQGPEHGSEYYLFSYVYQLLAENGTVGSSYDKE
jgi:hypothetical protein